MTRKLIPLALGLFGVVLAGCNPTEVQSAESTGSTPVTVSSPSSQEETPGSSVDEGPDYFGTYEEIDFNPIYEGGTDSGRLVDIDANAFCRENFSYYCSFTTNQTDKSLSFKVSDPEIITVDGDSPDGNFYLQTHKSGNAILEIYNSQDMIVYRNVVRVRPMVAEEDLNSYLYEANSFVSICDYFTFSHYQLMFISEDTAILAGYDEVDSSASYRFTYILEGYSEYDDFYYFKIDTISSNVSTRLTEFMLSSTGDMLMVYYDSGMGGGSLLAMLTRDDLQYLHS